jgi:hypothetical protein
VTRRFASIRLCEALCGVAVFVDQTVEQSCPVDGDVVAGRDRLGRGSGWLGQGAMRTVIIEVAGVDLHDGLQMVLGENQ